jgi:signal transduction histidine kinase/ActR/RegA family two-component response regulator
MPLPRWLPATLAQRFALAAAGLAAVALLLTTLLSFWLIDGQRDRAVQALAERERQFRAAAVGSDLRALAERMQEIAGSTILATGLVDSAGRETYLAPFLGGIRQINGIGVQVLFTDFEGKEIARNSGGAFSAEQMAWLRRMLEQGRRAAQVFAGPRGAELVAVEPMIYSRTNSPEGAVLYKVALADLNAGPAMRLEWGAQGDPDTHAQTTPVPAPPVFQPLAFRVRGPLGDLSPTPLELPYVHVLGLTLLVFSALVLAGARLSRLLTGDLQRLERFSGEIMASGLAAERAPEGGTTEVANLARSINDMLSRLDAQRADLLAEREKLHQLTEALQQADRRKDDFLAMLGHELRNPLAPISAGAHILGKLAGNDPRVVRTSEVIARQVRHMTKIVDDLLDVSRVTRGLVTLEQTTLDVAEVVAASVEQARPLIENARHELSVSPLPQAVYVRGDRGRLVQVLSNLLSNAARYTPPGGRIALRCEWVPAPGGPQGNAAEGRIAEGVRPEGAPAEGPPAEVRLVVQDNGQGVAADLLPHVFDLFTQGVRSADRSQGGLGLGLALVKNLVELHGGWVRAESPGPGQGATFTIGLPCVAAPALAPEAPDATHAPAMRPLDMLVVDDNLDAAQTLAQWLQHEGHAVAVAHDGPAALQRAAAHWPQVFILDIGLPGMDGCELARRLRVMPRGGQATLIALTGYGQQADRDKAREAGFDHHLVKPADPEALRRLLAQVGAAEPARAAGA